MSTQSGPGMPVKIVLQRRAHDGQQEALEGWVRALVETASSSGGLEGSSVLTTERGEYFVLLRFASATDHERWTSSREVREHLRAGDAFSDSTDGPVQRSGFETWFTLPGMPAPAAPPPKWKMAVITWIALLPQVLALSYAIPRDWPRILNVATGTLIPVAVLTWFAMPRLTRLLYAWLYPHARGKKSDAVSGRPDRAGSIGQPG